jgi:formamidopyrimidine-DNA glycosylase
MPELPEVEIVRRGLEACIIGRRILRAVVRDARLRVPIDAKSLARGSQGRTILGVERRAKYLIVKLSDGASLLMHLGMSGRLLITRADAAVEPHTHVVFVLDDGRELRFRDPRRFGMVEAVANDALATHKLVRDLGVEPLTDRCTPELLQARARKSKKPIKSFIMDARVIAGVGNIYACESLHRAGIRPTTPAGRLTIGRWTALVTAIQHTLADAVRQGGTTLNDFAGVDGGSGYFQVSLRVYDRGGESCSTCETPIRRQVLAGRSTFWCPSCQR